MRSKLWLLLLVLVSGGALADGDMPDMSKADSAIAQRFYVAPMFSYTFADSDRKSDDGLGGSLIFGKQITEHFNLELVGSYAKFKGNAGGHERLIGAGIDALIFPSKTLPGFYGVGGVAYGFRKSDVVTDPDSSGDSSVWNLGLGYLIGPIGFLNDGALRIEARERSDANHDGAKNDFLEPVVSVGLLVPIGAAPTPPPPVQEPVAVVPLVAPPDSDGDGLTDDKDQCPNTPAGTQVNEVGCPLPPPCKPPEAGQKVDLSGCAVGDTIILRGVNFEFDKASLTVNAKTILDGVADALTTASDIRVEVGGHTDSKGSDDYNQKLSEARAQSVMTYLSEHGIASDRMTAVGYGETQPIADNDTDEGRELNRRVELKITGAASPQMAPASAAASPEASGIDALSVDATGAVSSDSGVTPQAEPDTSGDTSPSDALVPPPAEAVDQPTAADAATEQANPLQPDNN